MDYFNILNLQREPFSNSPDPSFFYQTRQHLDCLQQLELAIRLRRGLNVVIGPVGTGKTTLCRELLRRLAHDDKIRSFMMLDPHVSTDEAFLMALVAMFQGDGAPDAPTPSAPKEIIKQFLFAQGVEQQRTVVLLIDEGQKIRPSCLEILRELLNYETNAYKLLQIVIFAQQEFDSQMRAQPNFADRINLRVVLQPLGFLESCALIRHRIKISGALPDARGFFTWPALGAIYLQTGGYPRRIIHLCHRCLLTMIVQNRKRAGWRLVRACGHRLAFQPGVRGRRLAFPALAMLCLLALVAWWRAPGRQHMLAEPNPTIPIAAAEQARPNPTPSGGSAAPDIERLRPAGQTDAVAASPPEVAVGAPGIPHADQLLAASPINRSPAGAVDPPTPPTLLGDLTVARNETLGDLIRMLYGRFTPDLLERVGQANPQLHNPDTIEVGQNLRFPALPTDVKPSALDIWWLQLAEYDQLEAAMVQRRRLTDESVPVELIAHWTAAEGLRFSVVLRELFYSPEAARIAVRRLPANLQIDGRVCALWQPQRVFFRNPFNFAREARHAPSPEARWGPETGQGDKLPRLPFGVPRFPLRCVAAADGCSPQTERQRARA